MIKRFSIADDNEDDTVEWEWDLDVEDKKRKAQSGPSAEEIFFLGLSCYYNGKLDEAIAHFERAITLDENDNKSKEMRAKADLLRNEAEKGKIVLLNSFIYKFII